MAKDGRSSNQKDKEEQNHIRLSAPWVDYTVGQSASWSGKADESVKRFIDERTRVHSLFIQEEARTKRLTLVISATFLLAAMAIILFAPDGREIRSFLLSGVLLVFAAGTFGYKRVYAKTRAGSFGADMNNLTKENESSE